MKIDKDTWFLMENIPALNTFHTSLQDYSNKYISSIDYEYFTTCKAKFSRIINEGLPAEKSIDKCAEYLNPRFSFLAELLGSLYEVQRGWRRVLETYSLINIDAPVIKDRDFGDVGWYKFCIDSFWFADFGFSEKLKTFLKQLQRFLNRNHITSHDTFFRETFNTLNYNNDIYKLCRHPVAHSYSTSIDENTLKILRQIYLAIGWDNPWLANPLDIVDWFSTSESLKPDDELYEWIKSSFDFIERCFTELNKIPLTSSNNKPVSQR